MRNYESELNDLFNQYRLACPDVEPQAGFMPGIWQRIEVRHSFWFMFERYARTVATVCAALCLVLVLLNFRSASDSLPALPTYADALAADHSAERTYYAEALRNAPDPLLDTASGR